MAFIKEDNSCINYHLIRFFRHFVQSRNKHYSLTTLMSYSFYAETIPVLQKALAWPTDKLVRTIEFSTLLKNERLEDLFWLDNRKTFCDFFSLDYSSSDYEISVVKDFMIFSIAYNHYTDIEELYEYETDLFKYFDLDIARNSICNMEDDFEYYRLLLDIKLPSELTKDLMFDFLEICDSKLNINNSSLVLSFCKELNDVYKDEKEITYIELASKVSKCPFVFCFLVAYVKANNLFEIRNDEILKCLHPHFIIAFREFWWKCEVLGNNKDFINQQLKNRTFESSESRVQRLWETHFSIWGGYVIQCSQEFYEEEYRDDWYILDRLFSIGTELTYKYNAFCIHSELNGIDLRMNNDYMNPDNLLFKNVIPPKEPILNEDFAALVEKEGNISVSNEYCKKSEDESDNGVANLNCSDANEDEEEKIQLMCSILSPDIDKEKANEILCIFKQMAKGGKGKRVVTIFLGAIKAGLLVRCPKFSELKKLGFENIGEKSGFSKIHFGVEKNTGIYNYNKYPEINTYCCTFMEIKSQFIKTIVS